jgi:hypothetical protein
VTGNPRGPLDQEPNEPGWWVGSDGKWYPPESVAPTEPVSTSPWDETAVMPAVGVSSSRSALDRVRAWPLWAKIAAPVVAILLIAGIAGASGSSSKSGATKPDATSTTSRHSTTTASPTTKPRPTTTVKVVKGPPPTPPTTQPPTTQPAQTSPPTTTQPTTHTCHPGDPLAGVQNPGRLSVTKPCQTITGTICQLEFGETDGDKAFDIIVDPQYQSLLKSTNVNQCAQVDSRLALHLETIPQSEAGRVFHSPVAETLALKVGEYVSATGPLVQDDGHGGWTEIHPVEFVDVLR